jgi:hypothetical protein
MATQSSGLLISDSSVRVVCSLFGAMAILVAGINFWLAYLAMPESPSASLFFAAWMCVGMALFFVHAVPRLWAVWRSGSLIRSRVGLFVLPVVFVIPGAMKMVGQHQWQIIPGSTAGSVALWCLWIAGNCVVPFLLVAIAELSNAADSR